MDSFFTWEGWRGFEDIIQLMVVPALIWLWTKLDGVKAFARSEVIAAADSATLARQAMKADIEKVHSEMWKAITDLSREQLGQLKKQHEHELWSRDHFVNKQDLSSGLEALKQVVDARMDAFSEQIDANTAAVQHLMASHTRRGK